MVSKVHKNTTNSDANMRGRGPDDEGNPYASGSNTDRSLRSVQSESYQRNNNAHDFQKVQRQYTDDLEGNDDDFTMIVKPSGDAEKEAYKNADYQTRMRIERANSKSS